MTDSAGIPVTEEENPRTANISSMSSADVVRLMNEEDAGVAAAVSLVLDDVADRKSTRLNSSHVSMSYAVFCWNTKTCLIYYLTSGAVISCMLAARALK